MAKAKPEPTSDEIQAEIDALAAEAQASRAAAKAAREKALDTAITHDEALALRRSAEDADFLAQRVERAIAEKNAVYDEAAAKEEQSRLIQEYEHALSVRDECIAAVAAWNDIASQIESIMDAVDKADKATKSVGRSLPDGYPAIQKGGVLMKMEGVLNLLRQASWGFRPPGQILPRIDLPEKDDAA